MTTALTRPISRLVHSRREGLLVVRLAPEGLYIREKGRRTTYGPITYGMLFVQGAHLYAIEQKRQKAEARKQRREQRHGR